MLVGAYGWGRVHTKDLWSAQHRASTAQHATCCRKREDSVPHPTPYGEDSWRARRGEVLSTQVEWALSDTLRPSTSEYVHAIYRAVLSVFRCSHRPIGDLWFKWLLLRDECVSFVVHCDYCRLTCLGSGVCSDRATADAATVRRRLALTQSSRQDTRPDTLFSVLCCDVILFRMRARRRSVEAAVLDVSF